MAREEPTNLELIKRVLGDDYRHLRVGRFEVEEDLGEEISKIRLEVTDRASGTSYQLMGEGVGLVDSLFHCFVDRFASDSPSLASLELVDFQMHARLETKHQSTGSDATAEVTLAVRNSNGNVTSFAGSSRSVATSAVVAVKAMIEYFINAERAFTTLCSATHDARDRGRDDLVERYTRELAEIVKDLDGPAFADLRTTSPTLR